MARRWPGRSAESARGVQGSAAAAATARVRRWRARRRSGGRTAGAGAVPSGRRLRLGRLCPVSSAGAYLAGEVTGQSLVARIDLSLDIGVLPQQILDALGAQRGDIVYPAGPERPQPQQPARPVADRGGLAGVLLLLAGHERPPPGPARRGPAHLHLGAIDAQPHPLGRGVGEHISQGLHRSPGWPGTANPRAASNGRISPTARVMVERCTRRTLPAPRAGAGTAAPPGWQSPGQRTAGHDRGQRLRPAAGPGHAGPAAATPAEPATAAPVPRSARRACRGRSRCRYDATRPHGPISTTYQDRPVWPFTFPAATHPISPVTPQPHYRAPSRKLAV
jgi:hypothetical protein